MVIILKIGQSAAKYLKYLINNLLLNKYHDKGSTTVRLAAKAEYTV